MNVLFVIDPLASLTPEVDATVGLMDAAQRQGHSVWICSPEELSVRSGRVYIHGRQIRLSPRRRGDDHRWRIERIWYEVIVETYMEVSAIMNLVLLRIDPPVDARYLHTTYLLDLVAAAGVPVVNRPSGIRSTHEKLWALQFPQLCPPTMVTTSPQDVVDFVHRTDSAVVKPVDGFAGMDVWRLHRDDSVRALAESATRRGTRHVVVQPYLDRATAGNKRLFMLNGEVVGAVLRRPSRGDFRIGPPVDRTEIDAVEQGIVAEIGPYLSQEGLALAGLDIIDGKLIEVNVTCPGAMHKADALLGTDVSGSIMHQLLASAHRCC